jgi:hypothetical protein
MFAISVNDVPGWLVTIPPSGIGVPVAFTPGLVPHCDVLTATALELGAAADELVLLVAEPLLLHPARAASPMAKSATVARVPGVVRCILTCPHLLVVTA